MAYIKTSCEHCGGHIEYPSELAGQSVKCPHCQKTTILREPFTSHPNAPSPIQQPISRHQPTSEIPKYGNHFYWIAAILFIIGLVFLRKSDEEQYENRMLYLVYEQYSAAVNYYEATARLYALGSASRRSVDAAEAHAKEIREDIDKKKQRLNQMAAGRRFKMCLFFAGAAVFFIGGVLQSTKLRT